jgi:UDP-3-O-[3-hydroxymyristoyl] glucosamine N-acyltransferase
MDNLVQVAHNVQIGRGALIAAQVGVAGSSSVGDGCMLGGQVGISDHITVGNGARLGARSAVIRDVKPGETVFGYPAKNVHEAMKQIVFLNWLCKNKDKVKKLLKKYGE